MGNFCFLFATGESQFFRQPLTTNISFTINLEYTLLMISLIIYILVIYMGKRSRNLRNIDRMFVDASDRIPALGVYLDCKINHLA